MAFADKLSSGMVSVNLKCLSLLTDSQNDKQPTVTDKANNCSSCITLQGYSLGKHSATEY